jgi:hypothetical protein
MGELSSNRTQAVADQSGVSLMGEPVSKRSIRASNRRPGDAGVALLRPRLQPLSAEQRAEAVALLSNLLLAAARRAGDDRELATADRELRREGLAA